MPPRVLFVTSHLGLGGQEKQLVELVEELVRRGDIEIRVLSFHSGEREGILRVCRVPTTIISESASRHQRIRLLVSESRRFRPNVVQAFDCAAGLYAALACRPLGIRVFSGFNASYLPSSVRSAQKLLLPLIDKIVCNSQRGYDYLRSSGGVQDAKLALIRNGFDFRKMDESRSPGILRAELGLGPERPLVGLVGKLNADKVPLNLAAAALELKSRYPNVAFCVIGSGPHLALIQDFISSHRLSDVFFLLPQRPDAPYLSADFDIAVLCSETEGLPNAVLEYMYWGKPCVVTDVGDCSVVVQDGITGLVVPPAEPKSLARAIATLLDNPAAAQDMGLRGRERLEKHYRIERYAEEFVALYKEGSKKHVPAEI